jgi:hypothetical protein
MLRRIDPAFRSTVPARLEKMENRIETPVQSECRTVLDLSPFPIRESQQIDAKVRRLNSKLVFNPDLAVIEVLP